MFSLLLCASCPAYANDAPPLDHLIVYGEGFSFVVKEPPGWTGDTQNASRVGANVVFYRAGEKLTSASTLIRVRLGSKVDEDTAADLKYDMDGYRSKYPKVRFINLSVTHPRYSVFSKLFFLPDSFAEYVVYLNPGSEAKFLFSASMNKQKEQASAEELAVFQTVVESISFLTANVKRAEP